MEKKEKIFNCLFILLNLKEVMKREIWKYKKQNKNRFPEKKGSNYYKSLRCCRPTKQNNSRHEQVGLWRAARGQVKTTSPSPGFLSRRSRTTISFVYMSGPGRGESQPQTRGGEGTMDANPRGVALWRSFHYHSIRNNTQRGREKRQTAASTSNRSGLVLNDQ